MKSLFLFCTLLNVSLFSTELKGYLTDEEIALFHAQGYLLKENVLSREEKELMVRSVSKAVDEGLEAVMKSNAPDQTIYINKSRIVFQERENGSRSIVKINGCTGMAPDLLSIVRSEKLLHTFFEIIDTDRLEQIISQIHPKLPNDGLAFPKHRDVDFRVLFDPEWDDFLGNGSYAICIFPVDAMSKENGGLWIDRSNYPVPREEDSDIFWVEAKLGDLLFIHPHLWHGSEPNASSQSRKTLLAGFAAYGANHKTYPGADVNTVFKLTEDGIIEISKAPWAQDYFVAPKAGH